MAPSSASPESHPTMDNETMPHSGTSDPILNDSVRTATMAPSCRRIQVSREKRPLNFFVTLSKKFLLTDNVIELSGLGLAVTTVVTIAELLKAQGLVYLQHIQTSLVDPHPDGHTAAPKAKIQIWIHKTPNFDELMPTFHHMHSRSHAQNSHTGPRIPLDTDKSAQHGAPQLPSLNTPGDTGNTNEEVLTLPNATDNGEDGSVAAGQGHGHVKVDLAESNTIDTPNGCGNAAGLEDSPVAGLVAGLGESVVSNLEKTGFVDGGSVIVGGVPSVTQDVRAEVVGQQVGETNV